MREFTLRSLLVRPARNTVKVAFFGPQLVMNRVTAVGATQLLHTGQRQQLVPSMATGSVATMLTSAGRLAGGGSGGRMLMSTGAETVDAPPLSVALAVSATLVPTGAFVQTNSQ